MPDLTLKCADCGKAFTFTTGEQKFFAEKGLSAPKRCKTCRARKKQPTTQWWQSPYARYGTFSFGAALVITGALWLSGLLSLLWAWVVAINLVTVGVFGYDKFIAEQEWQRVPEGILLALTFCLGAPGGVSARLLFRHKTTKPSFQWKFWAVVVGQIVLVGGYLIFTYFQR